MSYGCIYLIDNTLFYIIRKFFRLNQAFIMYVYICLFQVSLQTT